MIWKKDDRRSFDRRKVSLPIKLKLKSYDDFMHQYVTDISAGGLFIATPTPYEMGDIVEIEFYLEDKEKYFFKVRGEVARINQNPLGMGIRFTEIEEGSQELLNELLADKQESPDKEESDAS